jgi:hypothetical protein
MYAGSGHPSGVALYLINDRNVEFEGLLSVLSVPPLGIFNIYDKPSDLVTASRQSGPLQTIRQHIVCAWSQHKIVAFELLTGIARFLPM